MPLYEYTCKECQHNFEFFQRSSVSEEKAACPQCGSADTIKAFSTFAAPRGSGNTSTSTQSCPTGQCPLTPR